MKNHDSYDEDATDLEEWRDIPDWEGYYQASDLGRIKSLARVAHYIRYGHQESRSVSERILRPSLGGHPGEYRLVVSLHRANRQINRNVHQLVLEAFVGLRPKGYDGCHNDGNPLNNHLDNLRWDTKKNNQQDRVLHGTDMRGERNGRAKLTEDQVREIRTLAGSATKTNLGKQFGVSVTTISRIISRDLWPLVSQEAPIAHCTTYETMMQGQS